MKIEAFPAAGLRVAIMNAPWHLNSSEEKIYHAPENPGEDRSWKKRRYQIWYDEENLGDLSDYQNHRSQKNAHRKRWHNMHAASETNHVQQCGMEYDAADGVPWRESDKGFHATHDGDRAEEDNGFYSDEGNYRGHYPQKKTRGKRWPETGYMEYDGADGVPWRRWNRELDRPAHEECVVDRGRKLVMRAARRTIGNEDAMHATGEFQRRAVTFRWLTTCLISGKVSRRVCNS